MKQALGRIYLLAANTVLEAIRQRFFNLLLLLSVGFVLGSLTFKGFNFGSSELKFIADFGLGALTLFGSILAIVATAQLFFSELENRTALTLLAKPTNKFDLLAGKFFGCALILLIFALLIATLLTVILYLRESQLLAMLPEDALEPPRVLYAEIYLFALLQWLKFGVLSTLTLLVGSFARSSLFTITLGFMLMVIGQLQYIAQDAYSNSGNWLGQLFTGLLALLFPNLQLFNIGDHLVFADADHLPELGIWRIALYGVFYAAIYLSVAFLLFRKREL